jgi:hypothetical protein
MDRNKFLLDIQDYINKSTQNNQRKSNLLTCDNIFKLEDGYKEEKRILSEIKAGNHSTTTNQGDLLEKLLKNLFDRISLISNFSVTNRDTFIGQIDVILTTIDTTIYEIWGLTGDCPSYLIGECKNYKKSNVSRPEIEKSCWRAGKGKALSFFVGKQFSEDAVKEIGYFNLIKGTIFVESKGIYIVPFTLDMIDVVISNDLNFCYFIRWAIQLSINGMSIANYL